MEPGLEDLNSCETVNTCAPKGTDNTSLYNSLMALCTRVSTLEQEVARLKQDIPTNADGSSMRRFMMEAERRLTRIELSAITCIVWNEDDCKIGGVPLRGNNGANPETRWFNADPCVISLNRRVAQLEGTANTFGDLTAIVNQISELETKVSNCFDTVSLNDDCQIVFQTQGGTVTTVDPIACAPGSLVLMQENRVSEALDELEEFEFTVATGGFVEIDVMFAAVEAAAVYEFDILNDTPIVINQYLGTDIGCYIQDGDFISRKALITLEPGTYTLRVRKDDNSAMPLLETSVQIKQIV